MFQGPKVHIAQICEVHLQYENSTTQWPFYNYNLQFFLVNDTQIYILFSLGKILFNDEMLAHKYSIPTHKFLKLRNVHNFI